MKKIHWLALLALVCVLLTGCRKQAQTHDVGSDWRTWGQVSDSASFETADGEQVKLLLCVFEENAVLYYDDAVQTEFAVLQYPHALSDAQEAYSSWTLYADGGAHPDAELSFVHADGTRETFLWLWDGAQYAYSSERSSGTGTQPG